MQYKTMSASGVVKSGHAILRGYAPTEVATDLKITIHDGTDATGDVIMKINIQTGLNAVSIFDGVPCSKGIYVAQDGTADFTIFFE